MTTTTESTSNKRAFTPKQACDYLGIDTETDALKKSRSTGILWGTQAPKFCKVGTKKVIYLKEDLDSFLESFERYDNNAQIEAGELI